MGVIIKPCFPLFVIVSDCGKMPSFYRTLAIFYTVYTVVPACLATSSDERNDPLPFADSDSKPLQRLELVERLDNGRVSHVESDFSEGSENAAVSIADNLARYKAALSPAESELSQRSCTKDVDAIGRACRCDHHCDYHDETNNLWCYLEDPPAVGNDWNWCCYGECFLRRHWLTRQRLGWKCRGSAYIFIYEYIDCNEEGSKGAYISN